MRVDLYFHMHQLIVAGVDQSVSGIPMIDLKLNTHASRQGVSFNSVMHYCKPNPNKRRLYFMWVMNDQTLIMAGF